MKSNSNQVSATASAIIAAIDWEKLDGSSGKNVLQQIQTGFHGDYAGKALTKWLEQRVWEFEPLKLIQLEYPHWVEERLTPAIDDEEPFSDGTLTQTAPVFDVSESLTYAMYYERLKNKRGLLSCAGLKTLSFFSEYPLSDFSGKRIIGWKSAVVGKHGGRYVPSCIFPKYTVEPGDVEWLDFTDRCKPVDWTLKIHA